MARGPDALRRRARRGPCRSATHVRRRRWRCADGIRCEARARLHQRASAERRCAALDRKLDLHRQLLRCRLPARPVRAETVAMMPLAETGAIGPAAALIVAPIIG